MAKNKTLWVASVLGAILGYGLLHPYAMSVYSVFKERGFMLFMGLPFALVGALLGLSWGLWILNKNRRIEAEKTVERLNKQLADLREKSR